MEKTIKIDDKEVTFRASAALILYYEQYMNSNLFKDLSKVQSDKFEAFKIYPKIIYCMAKCHYKNEIGNMLDWYDTFTEFPIHDVFIELEEILKPALEVSKKKLPTPPKKKTKK